MLTGVLIGIDTNVQFLVMLHEASATTNAWTNLLCLFMCRHFMHLWVQSRRRGDHLLMAFCVHSMQLIVGYLGQKVIFQRLPKYCANHNLSTCILCAPIIQGAI